MNTPATQNRFLSPEALCPSGALPADCLLVDVRTPAEFEETKIAGAWNLPLSDLDRSMTALQERAGQGKRLVLVCKSGMRSRQAMERLDRERIACCVLEGGVEAWARQGFPVIRGKKTISLERQVRIAAGGLTVVGVALGYFVHPVFLGLSAFVGAGLVFSGVTDTCGMAMLLAKLPYNRKPR